MNTLKISILSTLLALTSLGLPGLRGFVRRRFLSSMNTPGGGA